MSGARPFLDTNVLIYLLSGEVAKADRAEALLAAGAVVSVQVLNEFVSVATRKHFLNITEVREVLAAVKATCLVVDIDLDTHERALDIAERFGFMIYGALILAAAMAAGCATLYTEDLQHGQVIGSTTVRNPFVA